VNIISLSPSAAVVGALWPPIGSSPHSEPYGVLPASAADRSAFPNDAGLEPLATRDVVRKLLHATDRPVLLVGREAERSAALAGLATDFGSHVINLGLELASALLSSDTRFDIAARIAALSAGSTPLLLDQIEILFLPQLKIDLLDTLVRTSRRRPICVSWPGRLEQGRLRYANYNHPESFDEDAARVIVHDLSTHEGTQA
jgi:hypothetical protein